MVRSILWFITCLLPAVAMATRYELAEDGGRLIGEVQWHQVKKGDYFNSLAKQYNVGMLALMEANLGIDPFLPAVGQTLKIPTQMLLPDAPKLGIVINLPELRLYYYPKGSNEVHVFPVGIGRVSRVTPQMTSKVKARIANPSWTPSTNTRLEYFEKYGKLLPAIFPAGPDNPLGNYAIQIAYGNGNYWIHGTNQNFGIGMRVSSGCIRLYPQDIEWLFNNIKTGESVVLIDQAIKTSSEPNGDNFLEVHVPLSVANGHELKRTRLSPVLLNFIELLGGNGTRVNLALKLQSGIPVNLSEVDTDVKTQETSVLSGQDHFL